MKTLREISSACDQVEICENYRPDQQQCRDTVMSYCENFKESEKSKRCQADKVKTLREILLQLAVASAQSTGHVSATLHEDVIKAESEINEIRVCRDEVLKLIDESSKLNVTIDGDTFLYRTSNDAYIKDLKSAIAKIGRKQ